MHVVFSYAEQVRSDFPELRSRAVLVEGIAPAASSVDALALFRAAADARLAAATEGEFPEIQAWRRAFSRMGLKPTQYRCASEALLRRYRKEGALPALHPLIDLCNAASLAFAIPIAVFDTDRIVGGLTVRPARGDETYTTFSGEIEQPNPGDIVFADEANRAHARRWTNRQSGCSAVSAATCTALVVMEALHETAEEDTARLAMSIEQALKGAWPACNVTKVL